MKPRSNRCKCGKPKRIRHQRKDQGLFYAHNCVDCQRNYMLKYNLQSSLTIRAGSVDKQVMAKSLKAFKIVHRALTGVALAR